MDKGKLQIKHHLPREIQKMRETLEIQIKKAINKQCEENFLAWKFKLLSYTDSIDDEAPGLSAKLEYFINQHKLSFYKAYQQKCEQKAKEIISLAVKSNSARLRNERVITEDFRSHKDRIFLETYLLNNKNQRQTALELGIPKSTFNDWIKNSQHLIESEEKQKQA